MSDSKPISCNDPCQGESRASERIASRFSCLPSFRIGLLMLWAISTTSAWSDSDEMGPFRIQQGTTPIACSGTPFGNRLPIGIDQEVLLTLRTGSGGMNVGRNVQLSGDLQPERSADPLDGVLSDPGNLKTAPVDLNGDGLEEMVVVSELSEDRIGVRVLRRDPVDSGNSEQIGDYEWTLDSPASVELVDIAVTGGDLDGSTDGREEVAIAMLYRTTGNLGRIRIIALSGDENGNIQQASGSAMATFLQQYGFGDVPVFGSSLQITADDFLLEGRDQVVIHYDGAFTVLRAGGTAVGSNPSMTFNGRSFRQPTPPSDNECPAVPEMHAGDFGGSAAREIIIHRKNRAVTCSADSIKQELFFFEVTRDGNDQIINFVLSSLPSRSVSASNVRDFAAAAGQMDRRPGDEIVLAWEPSDTPDNPLRVEIFRVDYDENGLPASIGPSTPEAFASINPDDFELRTAAPFDMVIGDAEGDAIGDVYIAAEASVDGDRLTRVLKFAMSRPSNPNQFPDPTSFQLVGDVSLPSLEPTGATIRIEAQVADWDNDSVLGDIGVNCVRVVEPQVRTMVRLPPYWELLQAESSGFDASIGQAGASGTITEENYGTFSSSDVSGFVGLQAGGNIFGIGASTTVKATAGKNEQVSNSEVRSETELTETTQSQSQDAGEGLVVLERNTYNCFTYDVFQNGAAVDESSLRVCELLRRDAEGNELRSFVTSDLDTWDTFTAEGTGGNTPAQWAPLHPDWSSQALFHQVTTSFTPINGSDAQDLVDGLFDTAVESDPAVQPYVEIDLGSVRQISNVRVFPKAGEAGSLVGFRLFAAEIPFAGAEVPAGPGVSVFEPDPVSSNGVDRWNVRTRGGSPGFALMEARYIRLQHPEAAQLKVAEIQVFGDPYLEPPAYPLSVCDPVANDGIFLARVADLVSPTPAFRNVQVRGDLSWTGGFSSAGCGPNYDGLPGGGGVGDNLSIWEGTEIVGSGSNSWSLQEGTGSAYGGSTSVSHSSRVGAEIEVELGPVVAGSAYSLESGVTRENSSTMFWEESLILAGSVGGFDPEQSAPGCAYFPRPYSYVTTERSNVGYTHKITVVDYVVTENLNTWSRIGPNFPPSSCYDRPDVMFSDRFEFPLR